MAAFEALFGDKLESKSGTVSTKEALSGKAGVMIYFSAHWCPPCRGFTPKLAEFYSKHAESKNFEMVFVSSDKDETQFKDYFGEMPFKALPFADRDRKESLSKKFKVQGIPSLVVLGPDGNTTTADGRSKVMEHFDDCEGFPWKPPTFAAALGDTFVKQDKSSVGLEAIKGKTLGLYFSAHWCPPCRGFTPKLKEFYAAYKAKDPNFEIVFVSSDKSEDGMMSYFNEDHGDYLVLPFSNRKAKEDLSAMFGIEGIPGFVVVDAEGTVLNASARSKVGDGVDKVLANGWEPAPVGDMAQGPEAGGCDINSVPSIVIMCEGCDSAVQQSIEDAMTPLAKRYIQEGKASDEDPKYIFLIAKGGGPIEQLKKLTKKDAGEKMAAAGDKPLMMLFDIPDKGGFYCADSNDISTASIEAFLKSKEAGSEKRLQLAQ